MRLTYKWLSTTSDLPTAKQILQSRLPSPRKNMTDRLARLSDYNNNRFTALCPGLPG